MRISLITVQFNESVFLKNGNNYLWEVQFSPVSHTYWIYEQDHIIHIRRLNSCSVFVNRYTFVAHTHAIVLPPLGAAKLNH